MPLTFRFIKEIYDLKVQLYKKKIKLEHITHSIFSLKNELLESNKRYEELYDFNSIMFITLNENQKIETLNFKAAHFLGSERGFITGRSFLDFVSAGFREQWLKQIQALTIKEKKNSHELEMLSKNGVRSLVKVSFHLSSNQLIHLTLENITEQRQFETQFFEIKKSLNLINNLFQRANDALAALDCDLVFQLYNQSFEELFSKIFATQIKIGDNLKSTLTEFPELAVKINNACQKAFLGEKAYVMVENQTVRDESYFCYELRFYLIYNPHHQRKELVFHIRNFSEYKIAENKQRQQQAEIAHVGISNARVELASALAHEINQPLTAILAYSKSCLFTANQLSQIPDSVKKLLFPLEQIALQAEHAGEIIHRMKKFIQEGERVVQKVNINLLISETLTFLHYELLDFNLKVELNFDESLPEIMVDKVQIMQVILNLARNSIEALQLSHTINPLLSIKTEIENEFIWVHFRDNGPGIAEEFKNKILNSYFTTKPWGSGLGLAICRSLMEAHSGFLNLVAHNEGGAWFVFKLPII